MGDRSAAQKMFQAGLEAAGQPDKYPNARQHAYSCFASACFADPTWWHAFYQAGNNNIDLKLAHSAVACFRRALQCDLSRTERIKVLNNLAWQLQLMGRTGEALTSATDAWSLLKENDEDGFRVHLNLSVIYRDLSNGRLSLHYAQQAYALSQRPDTESCLAFALLFDGQYDKGLNHFESRFDWRLQHFTQFPYPKWQGEPDKTVLLVADQGLGDTLCYSRFVAETAKRCKYLHIICQHELLRLFQHAFVGINNINLLPGLQQNFPPADVWTTFVSLPTVLGLTNQQIIDAPAIESPVYSLPKTWKVPDRKFHIGIAWGGSPLNDIDKYRNIPVEMFYELYRVPSVQLYAMQVNQTMQTRDGMGVNHQSALGASGGAPLISDLSPYIHDVVDTMSLVRELDLVISAETALPHICSTIGKECWVPYSRQGLDYRAGFRGERKLWCPKAQFFPQDNDLRWEPVFDTIVEALRERVDGLDSKA